MPSRTALVALAALATVVAVGAGAALAADAPGQSTQDGRTITVAGSGEIDAEPDAAVVRLAVTARGDDAAAVSDQLANRADQLRGTLTEFGVPDEDVQTEGYNVREDPQTRESPNQTTYYGEQSFTVTLSNVDRVGDLIDAAVAGGATDVGGVHYTLSEDRRQTVRDQAIGTAIDEARSEAAVIGNETGLAVGTVRHASTQDSRVEPYRAELTEADASGGGASTQIDPRDVTVSATVEVTFDASA